ncbi:NUDIX hydrolase [Conexibacter woesei]|uniref:NUDIX hydrolase n=1 Tax=Conexibacter woesei (strain DSM 14684 / CCUG 47730 / CIP 108061 / JCM 11494 / NBRC 100937 / ID131577) TaxID=469383 RepID=D3FCZ6_CONWI|nr:NUDIX hydrolase [Conexibacter woesei]ADB51508.1 NUDIX hydrolase [Conexibacter woesei DSM 14684]
MTQGFEQIGSESIWNGYVVEVRVERFRHADGAVVERDNVHHPGAVGIVAIDDAHVWLVRQPREICGTFLLEVPAGKLDVVGEPPLETARRELAEEIGKAADTWEPLHGFFTSCGFSDERLELFLATGLRDVPRPEVEEDERIEILPWPLDRLDDAIAQCEDAKTLVGLMLLQRRLSS